MIKGKEEKSGFVAIKMNKLGNKKCFPALLVIEQQMHVQAEHGRSIVIATVTLVIEGSIVQLFVQKTVLILHFI